LRGEEVLIHDRQAARLNHYMPASLVHSQFEALEVPGPDETPIVVDVVAPAHDVVDAILKQLT
ncbi:MAG: gluconokinase, partial [Pseudomonadota bacterium]|nr:gluconokinase [Pseudomonadota bacterium]